MTERLSSQSRASFLSVTSAQGERNNTTAGFDFVNVTQLGYDLFKGLGANIGISLNREVGFNTTAGLQYVRDSPSFLLVISPNVLLNGDHDLQNVLVAKFQPAISRKWRLHEAAYVFSDYDPIEQLQQRGFLHLRSGAVYKRMSFGLAADFDWYGMPKSYRTNYGPFLGYAF